MSLGEAGFSLQKLDSILWSCSIRLDAFACSLVSARTQARMRMLEAAIATNFATVIPVIMARQTIDTKNTPEVTFRINLHLRRMFRSH